MIHMCPARRRGKRMSKPTAPAVPSRAPGAIDGRAPPTWAGLDCSSPISRILSWVTIHLGRMLPRASCGQPGGLGRAALERLPIRPCTGWGLPGRRVATTPVRSCRTISPLQPAWPKRTPACCVISVALSRGFPLLDVIQHPALRCPDFPRRPRRSASPRLPRLHHGFYHRPPAHSEKRSAPHPPGGGQAAPSRPDTRYASRSSGKKQAASWPSPCASIRGTCSAHRGLARKQRGWNTQPEGGLDGLGTSPSRT
jgi:hypothetical protein